MLRNFVTMSARALALQRSGLFTPLASGVRGIHGTTAKSNTQPNTCTIVYDGGCPVCRVAVRSLPEDIKRVDARDNSALVKDLQDKGYNLDKGIVLQDGAGNVHFGPQALQELAAQRGGLFSFFANYKVANSLYDVLKTMRSALIKMPIAEQQAREVATPGKSGPM